jgi:hypothetical protein
LQLLHFFLSSIVVLLSLQSNLLGGFRLKFCGFCAILRGLCAFFDLLEQLHRLQHTWCICTHSSSCLGISGSFFSKSFSAT